jgi:endoglucanase
VPRGYAVSGMEFAATTLPGTDGTNYTHGTSQDFSYFAGKGLTVARVAFLWERAQPTLFGSLATSTYISQLVTMCNSASSAGVKILFEPHDFGAYYFGAPTSTAYKIGTTQVPVTAFSNFWSQFVSYIDASTTCPVYGWDLMNEPNGMPTSTTPSNYNNGSSVTTMEQAAITAIRATGDTHYIVAETDSYAGLQAFVSQYGANPTPWLSDPLSKTYYSFHYYFDGDHSGNYSGANQSLAGSGLSVFQAGIYLATVAQWAIANNVYIASTTQPAIWIGEYGVPNVTTPIGGGQTITYQDYLTSENDFLNVMDQYNIAGTQWAAGSWYSSPTALSPANGYTQDADQMQVVGKHLGTTN